jgi:hypothetical protein
MAEQSPRLQTSVRKVLREVDPGALICLKDPRFEVMVAPAPEEHFEVRAYFPVHRRRIIARELHTKPQTRVLLVFSGNFADRTFFEDCLRDHLGHVLLYLRAPKTWNDCRAAMKEWRNASTFYRAALRADPACYFLDGRWLASTTRNVA